MPTEAQKEEFARFCRDLAWRDPEAAGKDLQNRLDFLDRLDRERAKVQAEREFIEACRTMARDDLEAAVKDSVSYVCVPCLPVLWRYEGIGEDLSDRFKEIEEE